MVNKISNLRECFPFFRENKSVSYLDFAATTFMPDPVLHTWNSYQSECGVAAGRSRSWLGLQAAESLEAARDEIKDFFNAGSEYELIFSKNATEAANIAAWGVKALINPGDMIVVTAFEHHSNYLPWRRLSNERSALIVELPLMDSGDIDTNMLAQLNGQGVKLVCATHTSNVTGAETDLRRLIQFARREGALTIVDATQATAHRQLKLQQMDIDCLIVSAHKMYGPKNIGGLFLRKSLIDIFEPLVLGGGMVWMTGGREDVWISGAKKFEGGTHDPGLALAWAQSCRFISNIGWEVIKEDEKRLSTQLRTGLAAIDGVTILNGGKQWSPAITSFVLSGVHSHDLEAWLGARNIIIRTGHLCAQTVLRQWGLYSVNRISVGLGATSQDVEKLLDTLAVCRKNPAVLNDGLYPEFIYSLAEMIPEKKRVVIAPDVVAHSDGLACGDHLSIELSQINGKCEFNVNVDGCLLCRASTTYMLDQLNEKSTTEIRKLSETFLATLNMASTNKGMGPWQTYQIPGDRLECVASPWRLLLAAIDSLSASYASANKLTPLSCDACVQSQRVIWDHGKRTTPRKNLVKQFIRFFKELQNLDLPDDFHWQPLGKCVLSSSELKGLKIEIDQWSRKDVNVIKNLRLPALVYNNFLKTGSIPKNHDISLLVKKQRIRHYVTQKELIKVKEIIRLKDWQIVPVKGAVTSKLYDYPAIRPHLDYDFVAASMQEAFALSSWLMSVRGFRFVTGGSVPLSLKTILDNDGREIITGHFHLEKIIYDTYQVVIDVNFPSFPLSRTSQFPLTFDKKNPSWEEQLVITLCHIFKHEFVYMKDINDAYLVLDTKQIDQPLLASYIEKHSLELYYQLLIAYLEKAYKLSVKNSIYYNKSLIDDLIIKWLLKKRWPYSRKAHFYAKAIDLLKRSKVRSGIFRALYEFIWQNFQTSSRKPSGIIGKNLGVPLNTRLYLSPVAVFKRCVQISDMQDKVRNGLIEKSETIVPGQLVLVSKGDTRIVVTTMGLFLPTTELQTVGDKQSFTVLAKAVLDRLKLRRKDLLIGATQAARPDLWLF